MKTVQQINAIEVSIYIDEESGDYKLELKMEFLDGTEGIIHKNLSRPAFRLELNKEEPKGQHN